MKALLSVLLFFGFYVKAEIPDIPIDSPSTSYLQYQNQHLQAPFQSILEMNDSLNPIVDMGERNLQWLNLINEGLEEKISLTSKENLIAYPIESPKVYNEELILAEFSALKANMPPEMSDVLFSNKILPDQLSLDKELYKTWAFKVDRNYQSALRWRMMQPYLYQLKMRKYNDARGFYVLKNTEDLNQKLQDYNNLSGELQESLKMALIRSCINSVPSEMRCEQSFNQYLANEALIQMKDEYWTTSLKIWNRYFEIPSYGQYPSVYWSAGNPNIARVPFKPIDNLEIAEFLKSNIEEEWQHNDWQLIADFDLVDNYAIDVIFKAGIVPHVPGLGSNIIYMDANTPINQWDVQWTIRHEFGHNLGFPDCYHEFYDEDRGVIINYQIDITDLMCSRRGVLQERHFNELKKNYYQ